MTNHPNQSSPYSSRAEIDDFVNELITKASPAPARVDIKNGKIQHNNGNRPLFVLDLDGNVLVGYSTVDDKPIEGDYPKNEHIVMKGIEAVEKQHIPFDADIERLLEQKKIKPGLSAAKVMDVRLPASLVETIKSLQKYKSGFEIAVLTSRGMEDARKIMQASGIEDFSHLTFAADSGVSLYLDGKKVSRHKATEEEKNFVAGVWDMQEELNQKVNEALAKHGYASPKPVWIEKKTEGLAVNVHYRELLDSLRDRGEPLDIATRGEMDEVVRKAVGELLNQYLVKAETLFFNGKPAYSLLNGPETIELKHRVVNKGEGLRYIVEKALEAEVNPSAIIYAGDDVTRCSETNLVTPGTDYYAFKEGRGIERDTGIPFRTIHTLRPAGDALVEAGVNALEDSITANDSFRIRSLNEKDEPDIRATITVASPMKTASIVEEVVHGVEQKVTRGVAAGRA